MKQVDKTGGHISDVPKNFSAVQEHCPPEKLFATRYSPFAVVIGSARASPSHDFAS
jgi:hypothetical protein